MMKLLEVLGVLILAALAMYFSPQEGGTFLYIAGGAGVLMIIAIVNYQRTIYDTRKASDFIRDITVTIHEVRIEYSNGAREIYARGDAQVEKVPRPIVCDTTGNGKEVVRVVIADAEVRVEWDDGSYDVCILETADKKEEDKGGGEEEQATVEDHTKEEDVLRVIVTDDRVRVDYTDGTYHDLERADDDEEEEEEEEEADEDDEDGIPVDNKAGEAIEQVVIMADRVRLDLEDGDVEFLQRPDRQPTNGDASQLSLELREGVQP